MHSMNLIDNINRKFFYGYKNPVLIKIPLHLDSVMVTDCHQHQWCYVNYCYLSKNMKKEMNENYKPRKTHNIIKIVSV